jgi:hypothetical protein
MFEKCKNCGKIKGEHKGGTLNCPVGRKTRIGYLVYHSTQVFEPVKKISKNKRIKQIVL